MPKSYIYDWSSSSEDGRVTIRAWGLDSEGHTMCVKINDFKPYLYLELPNHIQWNPSNLEMILGHRDVEYAMRGNQPVSRSLVDRRKLYYAHVTPNNEMSEFPFLKLYFDTDEHFRGMSYAFKKPISIPGIKEKIQIKIHENNASPILQLGCIRHLPTAGWIQFDGEPLPLTEYETTAITEYQVPFKNLVPLESDDTTAVSPLIMSFDIEVNSSNINAIPDAKKLADCIFQIACVFWRPGQSESKSGVETVLITLGNPNPEGLDESTVIIQCTTEAGLIKAFSELIVDRDPHIITGWNILMFDVPYLIDRAETCMVTGSFRTMGMMKGRICDVTASVWHSAAYGPQSLRYVAADGRVWIDLLTYARREYKFANYRLGTVATEILGATKDPLTAKDIFECYRKGVLEDDRDAIALVGKYCVQDSVLVQRLFDSFEVWVGVSEMAAVCNVPMSFLYTKGQQIKVFSQVYQYCYSERIVVEQDAYISDGREKYQGATVMVPTPGMYEDVVPFDFKSLYPTIIIAYNIDFSTLVHEKDMDDIPDDQCHIVEWSEHVDCSHCSYYDITSKSYMCCEFKYKFLKGPIGVLPSIIQKLLDQRQKTRQTMKSIKAASHNTSLSLTEQKKQQTLLQVLNKRQLSYKISANSMYGALGVTRGYLPCMPAAMSITALGRKHLSRAADLLMQRGAKVVYGDSVLGNTPIVVRDRNGSIHIRPIESLMSDNIHWIWKPYRNFKFDDKSISHKQQVNELNGAEVWTHKGWSEIRRVIRHKTCKAIYRVVTSSGMVDVTEDHSLLNDQGEIIQPGRVKPGRTYLLANYPPVHCSETPKFQRSTDEWTIRQWQAYILGCFFFGGYISECEAYWCIVNPKESMSRKLLEAIRTVFPSESPTLAKSSSGSGSGSGIDLVFSMTHPRQREFASQCYHEDYTKCIPESILHGSPEILQAFMRGYLELAVNQAWVQSIHVTGSLTASEIWYACKRLNLDLRLRNASCDIDDITFELGKPLNPGRVISIECITPSYSGYVYDLQTEAGSFSAGVGDLIVKNTDSCYTMFPNVARDALWNHARRVEREIAEAKVFPEPMYLEFENAVYGKFMITSKKRYLWRDLNEDGTLSPEIGKKGVLLARRDNCQFVRDIYENVVKHLFDEWTFEEIMNYLVDELSRCTSGVIPQNHFVITKSVRDTEDYTEKKLPEDESKRSLRLQKLKCNEDEYAFRTLPAHVQLAERMRSRGTRVDAGQRIEYVVTMMADVGEILSDKIEDPIYRKKYANILPMDYLYYIHLVMKPIDELLDLSFKQKVSQIILDCHPRIRKSKVILEYKINDKTQYKNQYIEQQYKLRLQKLKLCREIRKTFRPTLTFET